MLAGALFISACGSGPLAPTPIPTPTLTLTPRSTVLPTVGTPVPLGSDERPYQIILVPPPDSTATGTSLVSFLSDQTNKKFTIIIAKTQADVLNALCSDVPTFAWTDGWTMLAAQAQGCGTIMARIKANGQTGIRSDIVISPSAAITAVTGFRNRNFCRFNDQDTVTWILPSIMMKAGGFNPVDLKVAQNYPDVKSILQVVANNGCVAAIPAGSMNDIRLDPPFSDPSKVVSVLSESPELPLGGLVASSTISPDFANQVLNLFIKNTDQLKDLVTADQIIKARPADFNDILALLQKAKFDFKAMNQ